MKFGSWRQVPVLASLVALAVAIGCSGVGAQGPENSGQQLPFAEGKPVVVPANTILYVRLRQAVTAAAAHAGQTFTAALDQPLQLDAQTIVPQGAEVTGRVVAARDSGRLHTAGYVRITLSSLAVNGKSVAIQTSSAMAGGGVLGNRNFSFLRGADHSVSNSFQPASSAETSSRKEVGFDIDHPISFRLTQPLTIN